MGDHSRYSGSLSGKTRRPSRRLDQALTRLRALRGARGRALSGGAPRPALHHPRHQPEHHPHVPHVLQRARKPLVATMTGPNMNNAAPHFFKLGLYRDAGIRTNNVLAFDDVRIGPTRQDVE